MLRPYLLALVAPITLAAGCVIGSDSSLTLYNDSSYALDEVYLAEDSASTWGSNLLPGPLFPGDQLEIIDIECGTYDVLVVDETGVECELANLDLCLDDDAWVIDDFILDTCAFQ